METTVWAYQITPGSDENLYFAADEADCRRAAVEQRADLKEGDPEDYADMDAMALYRIVLRPMTVLEIIGVLNGEFSIIEACTVDRKFVGLVAD